MGFGSFIVKDDVLNYVLWGVILVMLLEVDIRSVFGERKWGFI